MENDVERSIASGQLVLNDDCRFLNEAEAVRSMGGVIIKIDGPQRGECVENTKHKSELEINLIKPDFTLMNWGDIDELETRIERGLIPFLKSKGIGI